MAPKPRSPVRLTPEEFPFPCSNSCNPCSAGRLVLGHQPPRDRGGHDDRDVILIAIFAGLAIAAGVIIAAKVITKANSIPTS